MIFRLLLDRPEGGGSLVLLYDPVAATLTDEAGAPYPLDAIRDAVARSIPVEPPGLETPSAIRIFLGPRCNYACAYCSGMKGPRIDAARSGSPRGFLENVAGWLPFDTRDPIRFEFWGGEPLVYWPQIVELTEGLRRIYPHAALGVITNGALLSVEKARFLIENGFDVTVSHDGPGQRLRGPDPFDDPVSRAGLLELVHGLSEEVRFNFNSVLTLENPSLIALQDRLRERTGHPNPIFSTEGLALCGSEDSAALTARTPEEHRSIRERFFLDLARPSLLASVSTHAFLTNFYGRLVEGASWRSCRREVSATVTISLAGDVLVGNWSNVEFVPAGAFDFFSVRRKTRARWRSRPECLACPVLTFCEDCRMIANDPYRPINCDSRFTSWLPYLAVGLFMLTGRILRRIEADRIRVEGVRSLDYFAPDPIR